MQNLFLGAPRYQHIGLVVIFRQNAGVWQKSTEIKGSQVSAECVAVEAVARDMLQSRGDLMNWGLQLPFLFRLVINID